MKQIHSPIIQAHQRPLRRVALLAMATGLLALLFSALLQPASLAQEAAGSPKVLVLSVDGAIGPASRDYVIEGITSAEEQNATLVVIELDTPGGLSDSMRDIIKKILNAEVPVATWVGPPGARAASAGTYILYASHIAAMAPSTNLGAATPVQIGGGGGGEPADSGGGTLERLADALQDNRDEAGNEGNDATVDEASSSAESDLQTETEPQQDSAPEPAASATEKKVMEDAVAYIQGLAERHGRNAEWAEQAVREAVSLTASDALAIGVIDVIAEDIPELLAAIDGREVKMHHGTETITVTGAELEVIEPDWRNQFLSVITNPTLAYILLMVGIYGLVLEGYNPGALVPGVIGGISLLLALYAFQILPINFAGLALMLLGFALIAVELFVPSFGILGVGGVVAVVFGSVILMDSGVPGFAINTGLVMGMGLSAAVLFGLLIYLVSRAVRRPTVSGTEALIGQRCEVITEFKNGRGRVHLDGEDWQATGPDGLNVGEFAEVVCIDGLTVQVTATSPS